MKTNFVLTFLMITGGSSLLAQDNQIVLYPDSATHEISRHIYGHFSEHLGRFIYGGFWVDEDSEIPNQGRIRTDVVEALKEAVSQRITASVRMNSLNYAGPGL